MVLMNVQTNVGVLEVFHRVFIFCLLVAVKSGTQAQQIPVEQPTLGWVVSGTRADGVPDCSYCLNILTNKNTSNYNFTGLRVGVYRCANVEPNEVWSIDSTANALFSPPVGNRTTRLCLDVDSPSGYGGPDIAYLPLRMWECDGSLQQQWYIDPVSSRIRSGLNTSRGRPLYLVRSENISLVYEEGMGSPYYNVYLADLDLSIPSKPIPDFTFQAITKYNISAAGYNSLHNGGFERSTILPSWPEGVNCSDPYTPACSKSRFFDGDLFSLCGWRIIRQPQWISTRAEWKAGEGNSSLLMSYAASINQTVRTQPDSLYVLSFSLAGYVEATNDNDTYRLCTSPNDVGVFVKAGDTTQEYNVDTPTINETETVWTKHSLNFTASKHETVLVFTGTTLNTSRCGPAIDDVRLTLQTSPSVNGLGRILKIVGSVVASICFVTLAICWWYHRRKVVRDLNQQGPERVKLFSLPEIQRATNNWTTQIGEGGFSTVYKAQFTDGTTGAVKVEKKKAGRPSRFGEEIDLLQRVNHRNLVNLIGFCAEGSSFCLVFEHLPNGTLFERLHEQAESEEPLPWATRMRICYQLACGLRYLHHETNPPIVHRDVKSANLLLTAKDSAKLADFGLSKAAHGDASEFHSQFTAVRGSIGYMDPKYLRSGVLSTKSDVYSYGVVLLELISGHRAIKDLDLLPFWAAEFLNDPLQAHHLVDEHLQGAYTTEDLTVLIDLVKMCLQDEAHLRPTMQQVVSFLVERQLSGVPCAEIPSVPPSFVAGLEQTSTSTSSMSLSTSTLSGR